MRMIPCYRMPIEGDARGVWQRSCRSQPRICSGALPLANTWRCCSEVSPVSDCGFRRTLSAAVI